MIIYPAIDVRGGKVVRLKEGDPKRQTTFSDDPVATASKWIEQRATWIHMVNLDGTLGDSADSAASNIHILEAIAALGIKVQFGGGLRSLDDIAQMIDRGASRVVIGTMAVQNPDIISQAIGRFGAEAISVALDARDGKVTTHGWQQSTNLTPLDFGRHIRQLGAIHALYTDVNRDGSLMGVNIHDTIALGREAGLQVIASGGITTMDEIHQLAHSKVVAGAIIGMALYEGKLTLGEALLAARG